VLFAGYAPVHFLCFRPVYERLRHQRDVEVWLSGGFRRKTEEAATYSLDGFYEPFQVDPARVIPIEEARQQAFDVLVCSHLSDDMFPASVGRSVQIFHGVSFKNFAVREKALRYDLLCLPGRYHAERYREKGLIRDEGRCLITGFPKVDPLVGDSAAFDRTGLLERLGVDPQLPTVLFAPTGGKHNALDVMGVELVRRLGAETGWNLLIKPHDHPKKVIDWFAELAPFESARVQCVRELDVVPLLRAADVLLTDASSVAVEYTLLDRPIVFVDVPKLFKNVEKRGAPLDLVSYGRKIGSVAATPDEVAQALANALADGAREAPLRRAMAEHVFHAPGQASERVAGVVRHAAGLGELPPGVEVLRSKAESAEVPVEPAPKAAKAGKAAEVDNANKSEKRARRRREAVQLLARFGAAHRGSLAAGLLATIGVVLCRLALPWPLRGIVELVFPGGAAEASAVAPGTGTGVIWFAGGFLVLAVATGVFELVQRTWVARFASRTVRDLRAAAIGAAARETDPADLIARAVGDGARLKSNLNGFLVQAGRNGLLLLGITCVFLWIAPKLGLMFLASGALSVAIGLRMAPVVADTVRRQRKAESRYAASVRDQLVAGGSEGAAQGAAANKKSATKTVRTTGLIERAALAIHCVVGLVLATALWIGVRDVRAGALLPGELFLFIAYALSLHWRAVRVGRQVARAGKVVANAERLDKLLRNAERGDEPQPVGPPIRLEGVRVRAARARRKKYRLGPIDLTVEPRARIAVLGPAGAGKTTLLEVLAGVRSAGSGAIHWGPLDVTARSEAVRGRVAYLPQVPPAAAGRLGALLGLAAGEAPHPDQEQALRAVGVSALVKRFEDGLEAKVRADDLSSAERRVLGVGRAMLGGRPLLVLDCPVEARGPAGRKRIRAVAQQAGGRTLIVAMRTPCGLSSFTDVVELRKGKVAFQGSVSAWRAHRRSKNEAKGEPDA
jgi:ATP-binding cassette subfamily B protein